MSMDNIIRWSAVAAVALLAAVAGWISYTHALDVVRLYAVPAPVDYAYPATVDGLIYVASMVLLDIARRGLGRGYAFWLAWSVLGFGILVTGAVNAWAGISRGTLGAVVYAWPALALVLSYELLMLLIRNAAQKQPETAEASLPVLESINVVRERAGIPPLPKRSFGGYEAGSVPSIRAIMKEQNVGFPKAKEHREALLNGASAG